MKDNNKKNWIDYFESTTILSNYFSYRKILLKKVLRYTNEGDLVLEIGTGTGWSSISLKMEKRQIVALDINLEILNRIKRLAQNLNSPLNEICADMKMLPFRDNIIQVTFSQGVLEHFDDETIIITVRDQIRVSPIVIVDVPTKKAKNQPYAHGDERWLSWKYWKKLLKKTSVNIPLIYGRSPSPIGFILPLGIYKLIGYRFSMAVGFICVRKNYRFMFGGIKERLID